MLQFALGIAKNYRSLSFCFYYNPLKRGVTALEFFVLYHTYFETVQAKSFACSVYFRDRDKGTGAVV